MWDKKDDRDVKGSNYTGGSGLASQPQSSSNRLVNIGQTIFIKGELTGTEDLTIEGRVEGKIELKDHNLTIGPNGKIKADVYGKNIVITGEVFGNAFASEKVEITNSGVLKGNIVSPRIVIADGAQFKGSVDMSRGDSKEHRQQADQVKPIASVKDDAQPQKSSASTSQAHGNPAERSR